MFWKGRDGHEHGIAVTGGSAPFVISRTVRVREVIDELSLFLGSPDTVLVETFVLLPCTCAITKTTGRKTVCSPFFFSYESDFNCKLMTRSHLGSAAA